MIGVGELGGFGSLVVHTLGSVGEVFLEGRLVGNGEGLLRTVFLFELLIVREGRLSY